MQRAASLRDRIRPREPADDELIVRLALRAFSEFSSDAGRSTLRMARAGTTFIAERAGVAVGFAVVRVTGDTAELWAIAVDEQVRAQGVGGALLTSVERELAHAGVRQLTLHTALANLSALELFVKHGFRTERRLPRYYRGVFEACAMRKRLCY